MRRTKIVCTIGPATSSEEQLEALMHAGMNVARLNFSHGKMEEQGVIIERVRRISARIGHSVAIMQDLQGPKIRLGDFEGIINVQEGQSLRIGYKADYEKDGVIPMQYDLSKKVKRGERLYIYDGKVKTIVTSVQDGIVHVRVENDGILIKRKGVNLPDTDFGGDVITKKDKEDLAFCSTKT